MLVQLKTLILIYFLSINERLSFIDNLIKHFFISLILFIIVQKSVTIKKIDWEMVILFSLVILLSLKFSQ